MLAAQGSPLRLELAVGLPSVCIQCSGLGWGPWILAPAVPGLQGSDGQVLVPLSLHGVSKEGPCSSFETPCLCICSPTTPEGPFMPRSQNFDALSSFLERKTGRVSLSSWLFQKLGPGQLPSAPKGTSDHTTTGPGGCGPGAPKHVA